LNGILLFKGYFPTCGFELDERTRCHDLLISPE
jgi:hypothetical protein